MTVLLDSRLRGNDIRWFSCYLRNRSIFPGYDNALGNETRLMATYSAPSPTLLSKEKEIETLLNQWIQAMTHGAIEDILDFYHHDAVLHPTISPVISDTFEKRRDYFTLFKNQGKIKASIDEINIRVYNNMAISSGHYTFNFTKGGKTSTVPARFSFIYLKTTQGWKIVEHHSSLLPQPASN